MADLSTDDLIELHSLKLNAPTTWRATSTYYRIAANGGICWNAEDTFRHAYIDSQMERTF